MKRLEFLILHCALTKPKFNLSPEDIIKWHTAPEPDGRGWSRPGYSDLLLRDGSLHNLVPFDQDQFVESDEMTWGVAGKNRIARHLCLEGGLTNIGKYKNPLVQFPDITDSLSKYIHYTILRHPDIKIAAHYMFDKNKHFCPGFDVPVFLKEIGVQEKNIYIP